MTDGQIIVMSSTGAMITQVVIRESVEITALTWSCEKFYLSEQEGGDGTKAKDSKSGGHGSHFWVSTSTEKFCLPREFSETMRKWVLNVTIAV